MKRYKFKLNECIIVAGKFKNDALILAKNRDRMYTPDLKIVRKIKNETEMVFIYDKSTGWAEGLNEHGIGIVNTALMVGHDEKEKKIVKKTGVKLKDGKKIVRALQYDNLETVVDDIVNYGTGESIGVKGHTFIGSAKNGVVRVEVISKHEAIIKSMNTDEITVRTNHGFEYTDAGYISGDDYLSSKLRKSQAEKLLNNEMGIKAILNTLKKQRFKKDSNLNMMRSVPDGMRTTCQIALDLTNLVFYCDILNGQSNFLGVEDQTPDDYEPKIKIRVWGDPGDKITIEKDKQDEKI